MQVRAGEVLARLFNTDAEQGLAEAKLRLEVAGSDLTATSGRSTAACVSAAQLASYKAEADLATPTREAARQRAGPWTCARRSPAGCWCERRLPPEGEVQAGTVLARVAAGGAAAGRGAGGGGGPRPAARGLAVRLVLAGTSRRRTAGRGVIREISPMVEAGGTVPVVAEVTEGAGLPPPGEGVEAARGARPREQTR